MQLLLFVVCWYIVRTRWWWSDVSLWWVGVWLWRWMYQKTCLLEPVVDSSLKW